jgi:hypothetical protein
VQAWPRRIDPADFFVHFLAFGQIVRVFSTYESRHNRGDAEPFQRGINRIQLYHDGKRWWIVKRADDVSLRLPDRYLPKR